MVIFKGTILKFRACGTLFFIDGDIEHFLVNSRLMRPIFPTKPEKILRLVDDIQPFAPRPRFSSS